MSGSLWWLLFLFLSCAFSLSSRYRAAVSLLCLSAWMYLDGVLVRRLLWLSLSRQLATACRTRRTAFSLARCRHRHMSQKRTVRNVCCAEAIEIRSTSNNRHCSDNNSLAWALSRERRSKIESTSARLRGGRRPRSLQPCISTLNRARGATRKNVREASVISDIEPLCL